MLLVPILLAGDTFRVLAQVLPVLFACSIATIIADTSAAILEQYSIPLFFAITKNHQYKQRNFSTNKKRNTERRLLQSLITQSSPHEMQAIRTSASNSTSWNCVVTSGSKPLARVNTAEADTSKLYSSGLLVSRLSMNGSP